MNETTILHRIRLAVSKLPGVKIFRNNVGALRDHQGRFVQFGLHPGSADLIGWKTITITPEMVGRKAALFVSLECKTETGAVREDQANWMQQVTAAGGIAGVVRSEDDALKCLGED